MVIQSVVYSSVALNAAVTSAAPAGSSQAATIQNNLNTYFTNLNLPDLAVTQTTVVDPGTTTTTTTDEGSNTTLIVAIVVPIVIVRKYLFI